MKDRMSILRGAVLALLGGVMFILLQPEASPNDAYLAVHFFDVGQGDAIYIETPDGVQVLIDGGPNGQVLQHLAREMSFFDRTIDMVIGTHQDLDHVAGLNEVLASYEVASILRTEGEGASPAAKQFVLSAALAPDVLFARAGQVFALGASTTLTVLSPSADTTDWASNTGSVVVKLTYGDIDFMLTGDAPEGIERYLVGAYAADLEAEVLKLGHHGSNTSSAAEFLAAVQPEYAVVSAGKDNRYNHPHPDVLERVAVVGATVLSTKEGTVSFYTDGSRVWSE